jgi:hypothetical protein
MLSICGIIALGCSDDSSPKSDSSVRDSAVRDSGTADSGMADSGTADSATPDGAANDATAGDGRADASGLDCAGILQCFKDDSCIVGVGSKCEQACLARGVPSEATKASALIKCEYDAVLAGCMQACAADPDSGACQTCLESACGSERRACGQ